MILKVETFVILAAHNRGKWAGGADRQAPQGHCPTTPAPLSTMSTTNPIPSHICKSARLQFLFLDFWIDLFLGSDLFVVGGFTRQNKKKKKKLIVIKPLKSVQKEKER